MSNIEAGIVLKVPKKLIRSDRSISSKLGRRRTAEWRKEGWGSGRGSGRRGSGGKGGGR